MVKPFVDKETKFYQSMLKDFNDEPIVDAAWQRRFWITGVAQENLDYYSRRKAAEWKVASVALSRTIFWCATAAKAESEDNFVALLGHSMGALMLEKTVIPACVGNLADNLPWFSSKKIPANPLTFDMILLVNSAAPAIYAKQVRDMFGSYQKALGGSGISHADMPLVYSVTSEADSATGVFHPLGNWFARFSSSLRRTYKERLFAKDVSHPPVRQSSFYVRTPGHHPLLVNHWIRPAREDEIPANSTEKNTLDYNLTLHSPDQAFRTRSDNGSDRFWVLTTIPSNTEKIGGKVKTKWSKYKGVNIVPPKSKYWILRCGPGIIKGHNDIWSNAAIDFYAALFGIAQAEKEMDTR